VNDFGANARRARQIAVGNGLGQPTRKGMEGFCFSVKTAAHTELPIF
jgi:hypothetical protein